MNGSNNKNISECCRCQQAPHIHVLLCFFFSFIPSRCRTFSVCIILALSLLLLPTVCKMRGVRGKRRPTTATNAQIHPLMSTYKHQSMPSSTSHTHTPRDTIRSKWERERGETPHIFCTCIASDMYDVKWDINI